MKRLIIYPFVAIITFSIGITLELISATPVPKPPALMEQGAHILTRDAVESPLSFSSEQSGPDFSFDYDPEEFDPRGVYYMIGRKPQDFPELHSFLLAVDAYEGISTGSCSFQTYANRAFNSDYTVTGIATKTRLTFVATPLSGDADTYIFDGHFLREGVLANPYRDETRAVLEGKLIKSKGCVKLAECEVRFRVKYLGC